MRNIAILSILAGLGQMPNSALMLSNPYFGHPVHAKYKLSKPKATRDRKNTGTGIAKAKRASRKAKNKARH